MPALLCSFHTLSLTHETLRENLHTLISLFLLPLSQVSSLSITTPKAMKVSSPSRQTSNLHLISTLLSLIPQLKTHHKGKLTTITTKLTTLQTHLQDLSHFPTFSSNPLSSDLLLSIHLTLTLSLSTFQSLTLSSAKLKTQSDLDSISAKLDQHIKDSDLLIKSGLLLDNVSSSSSSKREVVRIEARNLITRLQMIGNGEAMNFAMDRLLGLLQEDDKNVLIAVAQGLVPVLVRLLDSSCLEIKEKAVFAISRVSMVDSSKHVLVAEGILLLNHLLRVIESGSGFAKEKACIALQALSFSKENARAIGSRGGISSLLEICQSGSHTSQALAAGVLRNLALFHEIKFNFVEEDAVTVLIGVACSGTALAQENSIGCLCNLVSEDENLKILVVKEGGIECLKNYWDSAPTVRSLEVALGLLWNLACCRSLGEVLVSNGFISRLAGVLSCEVLGVRIGGARAVYELGFSTKARKEIGESGCVSPLVKMLEAKAVEEKDVAAKALSCVMQFVGNRRVFQKEERWVLAVVQLLDPLIHNIEKKYPILILLSVAQSKKCGRLMVAAGACAYLQKLVEMEVEGAKKLMESLCRGKVWGIFSRT